MSTLRAKLTRLTIPVVVFLTGAAVLVIEIIAMRILAPYFGTTIFSFSSIISVILAALSFGYFFGGRLADRRPHEWVFYGLIFLAGLSTIFLEVLVHTLLPALGLAFSIVLGPLVSSIVLFFMPAFLLGMLSPFAIKLHALHTPQKGVGTVAGEIFFASTFGSIFGSLLAGFVLVPQLGLSAIVLGVGLVLLLMGSIGLLARAVFSRTTQALIVFLLLAAAGVGSVPLFYNAQQEGVLYSSEGVYERIVIRDGEHKGQPTRFLQQELNESGAMLLNSDELAYDYTKYYILHEPLVAELERALFIGGGAYSMPKALLAENESVQIDVVEIEPELYELAKEYFRVPESERLVNHVADGRRFLRESEHTYDVIFADVYQSLLSVPAHFTTEEFFQLAQQKLTTDGILVMNLVGALSEHEHSFLLSEMHTLRTVFPNSYFFAVDNPNSAILQNIIAVGINGERELDLAAIDIAGSENPTLAGLISHNIDVSRFDLEQYPKLTDNYAPAEYLIARSLFDAATAVR